MIQRNPVSSLTRATKFVAAAFTISWVVGVVAAVILLPLDRMFEIEGRRISLFIAKYGPSLAGFVMMYWLAGLHGVKELLKKALIWKVNPIYYLIAIFLPIAMQVAVLQYFGASLTSFSVAFNDTVPLLLAVGTFLFFGGGFGEEFGWRGYLLPVLNERYTPLFTSLLIGIVWTAWHLPAFFFGNKTEESPPDVFVVFVVSASIFLTWLYYKTNQSVLFVALFHASYNASGEWVSILFGKEASQFGVSEKLLNWSEALAMLALAIVLVIFTKGRLGFTEGKKETPGQGSESSAS